MHRRPPRTTRIDTLFPSTTLCRSESISSIDPATPPFHSFRFAAQATLLEPPRAEIGSHEVRVVSLLLLVPLMGCDAPSYRDPFRATGETIAMSGEIGRAHV